MAEIISLSGYHFRVIEPPIPEGCSAVFAPCLDPECERPCGARRTLAEIKADERDAAASASKFFRSLAVGAAVVITLAAAGAYGLSHEERAYQVEARV